MDFWRSGTARTHREQPIRRQGPAGLWSRITGLYFPPWVPVVAIILVVFGILGALFISRTATGAPRIGKDHWHATYKYFVCGQVQPNFPTWEGVGVHTHGDGIIHIHPFTPAEEGSGARLEKWFEYGGGKLTGDEVRAPGSSKTYANGDACPDGRPGVVQVSVNGAPLDDWSRFIPHDGDRVRISFGPAEEATTLDDRTVIPDTPGIRKIDLLVTDDGTEANTKFEPASIAVTDGETVKIAVKNTGKISHGLRISGGDKQYGTKDDFVAKPVTSSGDIMQPGEDGTVVVRFETGGTDINLEFRDETLNQVTGTIVVRQGAAPTPTASPEAKEAVDVTLDMKMGDNFFEPKQLTVKAGQKFRINLTNPGPQFVHNLRIAGPDGQYDVQAGGDDLVSTPAVQKVGQPGELVGKIDTTGVYPFKCDFHPTEMTGTITVQ